MKKLLLTCLALLICLAPLSALAEPMLTAAGYTVYLGENNHLYLLDPIGSTKVLRHPMADILKLDETHVVTLAQDGRLCSIRLDGTESLVISDHPTAEEIAAATAAPLFELTEDGMLYLLRPSGTKLIVSSAACLAAANDERLFYVEKQPAGYALRAVTMADFTGLDPASPPPNLADLGDTVPYSMTATSDAVTFIMGDRFLRSVSLINMGWIQLPYPYPTTEKAITLGNVILRYSRDESGAWITETDAELPNLIAAPEAAARASSIPPTLSPTATPAPTAAPTATPRPTPTATVKASADSEYERIDYGDKGSAVRSMQKRLKALGYPVGQVDGTWGKNTQLAVNLFQCAIGYRERSYASPEMQEKLYSRKAPKYDPYAPLRQGDEGTDVKIMQQALFDLGYLGTDAAEEVDGKYGARTAAAVLAFQQTAGPEVLEATAQADKDTLLLLFSEDAPRSPSQNQPSAPVDPNYPELILPGTPGNPVVPPATQTDLVVFLQPGMQ